MVVHYYNRDVYYSLCGLDPIADTRMSLDPQYFSFDVFMIFLKKISGDRPYFFDISGTNSIFIFKSADIQCAIAYSCDNSKIFLVISLIFCSITSIS